MRNAIHQPVADLPRLTPGVSSQTRAAAYSFGFNGQEKDDEVYGSPGISMTAEFWQYDTRIGRRWNLDPVVKYGKSGYLVFSGCPISRVDANGADDYYAVIQNKLVYLGTDGSPTNNQRFIQNMDYSRATELSNEQRIVNLVSKSALITLQVPGGQSEGAYFKGLYDKGDGHKVYSAYREQKSSFVLTWEKDKEGTIFSASLMLHTNSDAINTPQGSMEDVDVGTRYGANSLVIGGAHTHQVADMFAPSNRNAAVQQGDRNGVLADGKVEYTIDSEHVDRQTPFKTNMSLKGYLVRSDDNIAPSNDLFEDRFSIARDAIEVTGNKPR